ncbi:MAG TPA: hypothetical protein VK891_14610 [Euzebyales bacterium]|nr:hypothetical protein [Euzebyales bacterium]
MWTTSTTTAQASSRDPDAGDAAAWPRRVPAEWVAFVIGALLLLDMVALPVWAAVVTAAAVALAAVSAARFGAGPWVGGRVDRGDLLTVVVLYAAVVGLFRLAFVGFTQANVAGLFVAFAAGLLVGTAGPIAYTTWVRHRPLSTLGLGLHRLPATVALAVVFAAVQFAVTLWGYRLPAPVEWVPLLVMSVVVGLFEAVFSAASSRAAWRPASGSSPVSPAGRCCTRRTTSGTAWASASCGSCSDSGSCTRWPTAWSATSWCCGRC